MVAPNDLNLFDIVKDWLSETKWDFVASQVGYINNVEDAMLGSIWISHYVLIYIYSNYVTIVSPYHSSCCDSFVVYAVDPKFFDSLYEVLINVTKYS